MKRKYFLLVICLFVFINMLWSCKKNDPDPDPVGTPTLSIVDQKITEGSEIVRKVILRITLSGVSDKPVSVNWKTEDASAKAGLDFDGPTSGTITFEPGAVTRNIEINLITDRYLELDEYFNILLSDAVNADIEQDKATITIQNDDSYTAELVEDGYITPAEYPSMTLVWADEFDGNNLNAEWWTHELGATGWGNNELQNYTNAKENSFVKDGVLTIKAIKNNYNNTYTSARLITKGKKEFTYGRIDIRAKMPVGKGIWPALWMLGGNISTVGWPSCGEIDIMEYLGHDSLTTYGTVHYNDGGHKYIGGNKKTTSNESYNQKYHVFSIIWQENSIDWYVDYKKYFSVNNTSVKFEAFRMPQFFIFNVAVGGNWPGYPDATTKFPQSMEVDYIRVFN